MRIYRVKPSEMDDYYLMGLLTNGDCKTNIEMVKNELSKRLEEKSDQEVLLMWKKSSKTKIREFLENHIAMRLREYNGSYNELSTLTQIYLKKVTSIDAIVTLTYAKCEKINQQAMQKYIEAMSNYLEYYDEFMEHFYQTEGSDLEEYSDNLVWFNPSKIRTSQKKSQELAKIYKINDRKSRRIKNEKNYRR